MAPYPLTHLYAGSQWLHRHEKPIAKTACGLRKEYFEGHWPSDVVDAIGRVTCPECRKEYDLSMPNSLSNGDLSGQSGKKAQ